MEANLFFSLLFCKLNKIPFLIQPHGMLLEDALRSNTYLNYLFKIITLKIYNIFLRCIFFLSQKRRLLQLKNTLKIYYLLKILFSSTEQAKM